MTGRLFLYAMAIPFVPAFAALAVILLPAGDHLSWARFGAGFASFTAIWIGGAFVGGRYAARH